MRTSSRYQEGTASLSLTDCTSFSPQVKVTCMERPGRYSIRSNMIFNKISLAALVVVAATSGRSANAHSGLAQTAEECTSLASMKCRPVSATAPTLDGKLDDWLDVDVYESSLTGALTMALWEAGPVKMQCQYDDERIYFAFQVPGEYRFDTEGNHFAASISTMMKMGEKASFFNMGNCPLAPSGDCESTPEGCDPYKVDLGGHWELKTTERGVEYPINAGTGSGNDLVANNDDEYAVNPYCRFDDDDANAGNEWAGAWTHSNADLYDMLLKLGQDTPNKSNLDGTYTFEMSRLLTTASTDTDAQLEAGQSIGFGFAYWDPYEVEETGWSDSGHYVTGCSMDWIDLQLVTEEEEDAAAEDSTATTATKSSKECASVDEVICQPTTTPPTLDGDLADWEDAEAFTTPLTGAITRKMYEHGSLTMKCKYDEERVYYAFEVPGPYRFDTEDNHLCASISTMMPIGEKATLFNMGGCPLAGDCAAAPEGCDPYRVDLGGHWELKTTEMGVEYPVNTGTGSGNDLVANNDDEYAVGPYCRFDDDDAKAGNEWAGAWLHTHPDDLGLGVGEDIESAVTKRASGGGYIFEMSRLLKTASTETDAQMEGGKSFDFGFAYWDPYEVEETGWSDAGHYVTGCSRDWIPLKLVDENGEVEEKEEVEVENAGDGATTSAGTSTAAIFKNAVAIGIAALVLDT